MALRRKEKEPEAAGHNINYKEGKEITQLMKQKKCKLSIVRSGADKDDKRPMCMYGDECYLLYSDHLYKYQHPNTI
jgi:PBZ domain